VSDRGIFWAVLVRDPYLFLGLVIVGVSSAAWWFVYRTLEGVGFKPSVGIFFSMGAWAYLSEYVRRQAKHGWPAWPLHVMWLSFVIGVSLIIIGISKL
jgi:hypothetical protein